MWIKKKELTELSENIRKAIAGQEVEFRDNKEGELSILKNDMHTLVNIQKEQENYAKKESEMLSKYLADISHQLKTPITSMMLMAILLEDAPPQKQREFIFNIKSELTHMEWLVASLLKMAKLESKTVTFTKTNISVRELLDSSMKPLEILLDIKNQHIVLQNDITLACDKRWTIEALTNLLKNASENTPESKKLVIDSGETPIYAFISVTDGGNGITREKLQSLFKRFENSGNEKGYGIGLPLALAIMRGQDGDIEVEPGGHGTGATFTMKFYK